MLNLGKRTPGSTVRIPFDSFDAGTGASLTMSGLAVGDIQVYKDGGTTQRASTAGFTLLDTDGIDFDSTTGLHGVSIDLSDNTTANFYEAGSEYWVAIASITIDGQTVNFWAARFTIGYEGAILDTTIATLSSQTSFTLEDGSTDNDAYNGCVVVVHDLASAVQIAQGLCTDYVGSSKTVTLVADPGIFTMAAGDSISFFPRVDVANWNGSVVATPTVAGVPEVDVTHVGGSAEDVATATALATVDTVVDGIQTDLDNATDGLGAIKGAVDGLNDLSAAQVNSEVDTALSDIGLDHLLSASVAGTDITDDSIVAQLVSASATADWDDFDNTTDSLQAIRDRGDSSWTTGAGSGLTPLASGTAQGGTSTTIQLAAGETFANDELNGNVVKITSGTGAGQARIILDYTGTTDTATVHESWTTTPDATSVYEVVEGIASVEAWKRNVPNGLQTGRVDASVGAMAANVITASATATDYLNEINAEVDTALADIGLDHLVGASVAGTDVVDNSIFARLVSASATADWDDFVQTTDSLQAIRDRGDTDWITATGFSTLTAADVNSEVDTALADIGLDHLLSASVAGTDITDDSIIAQLVSASATADWDDFDNTTDALQAIRDRGDAAWTTGAGGSPPDLLESTTLLVVTSQTSFTITAGSADNDAYNGCIAVITDASTSTQKAVGLISDYVGATKSVTLAEDPGIFTMAATDTIDIIAAPKQLPDAVHGASGGLATVDGNNYVAGVQGTKNTLDDLNDVTTAQVNTEVDTALTDIGLDHLVNASVAGTDVTDNSIFARLVSASATADWDDFVQTTDSLQALRDRGDAAWITATGFSTLTAADVNTEVDTALTDIGLDHLLSASVAGTDVTDNSVFARLVSASATADWDDFVQTTDSLQALRDRGDAAWITATGFSTLTAADVNTEVDTALTDIGLDHLLAASVAGTDVTDDSIVAKLVSKSATADFDDFVNTTDSLQAIKDTIGTPAGASIAADLVVIDDFVDGLESTIGVAGAGLTDLGGMSTGMQAEVEAEVNDALDTAISELGVAAPTATPTIRTGLMLLYMMARNQFKTQTSGTDALEVYNDAGTLIAKKLLTDAGGDLTEAKMTSG